MISVALAIGFALNHRRAAVIGAAALLAFVISTGVNPDTRQRAEDAALTELEQLGLPIHITELDVNSAQTGQRETSADDTGVPGWARCSS